MKILSLAQIDLSKSDGCVVRFVGLNKGFRHIGIDDDVVVISPNLPAIKDNNMTVYKLPHWLTPWFSEGIICNIVAWFIILTKCMREKYDMIYIKYHSNLALALRFAPVRIPIWMEVHSLFSNEESFHKKSRWAWLKRLLGKIAEKLALHRAKRIICIAPQLAQQINQRYAVSIKKMVVIPNGMDIEEYRPMDKALCRRQLKLPDDNVYIGFIGRFIGWAGIDTLISVLPAITKKYNNVYAIIVGDGEELDNYIAFAKKLGINGRVIFPGWVNTKLAPLWINAFDIGVALTHPKSQGFSSVKLLSYMACGIAVLATDIAEFEIVRQYHSGILVPDNDLSEVQLALEKLIDDKKLRIELGKNGRQCVEKLFSWQIIAKKIIST